jgi:di/tricarboxylate transporter
MKSILEFCAMIVFILAIVMMSAGAGVNLLIFRSTGHTFDGMQLVGMPLLIISIAIRQIKMDYYPSR